MEEQRGTGETVRAQRDMVMTGEANERGRGEEREKKFAEERVSSFLGIKGESANC